jgi:rSAM/selenodomain-associated transferase 2
VPVLNEAAGLPDLLDDLRSLRGRWEVVVADGGSTDDSAAIARAHPLAPRVIAEARGRAAQLNAGAGVADGEVLVFLHADSRLPPGAYGSLVSAWAAGVLGGNFRLRFDGGDLFARWITAVYEVQRRFGFYYGDSSVWVRRDVFDRLDGYRPLPIMDDYDFVRRLECAGRTTCLPGPATTSSRRWRRLGVARTVASWLVIRYLWLAGVPAERLARLYRPVR